MAVIEIAGEKLGKGSEWLLPNSLGGYSSCPVAGTGFKDYHGLLVSAPHGTGKRDVLVRSMQEEVTFQKKLVLTDCLEKFEWDPHIVNYFFSAPEVAVRKRIKPLPQGEGTEITYQLENKGNADAQVILNVVVDSALEDFKLWNDHTLGFRMGHSYVLVFSNYARCFENRPQEKDDNGIIPARFLLTLRGNEEREVKIVILSRASEEVALADFKKIELKKEGDSRQEKVLSSGAGIPIFSLLAATQGFIVKRDPKLGVISGYPDGGESGREALIALPGLALIGSNFRGAEMIMERFLNKATSQGIPTAFSDGEPVYGDSLDVTLWLVDRMYQYLGYTGEEHFKQFLHTYWWNLKDIFKSYLGKEKDGLLSCLGGTWMDGLKRDGAVEVQGLWYNSLMIMDKFSQLMNDHSDGLYLSRAQAHGESFLETFVADGYLKDSLSDSSFRPNQVIVLGLDFNVVPAGMAREILTRAEQELLTPYGLKTLGQDEGAYDVHSKFNGGAWPWLLGPFIKARSKFFPSGKENYRFMKVLFEEEVRKNCLGSLAEFFSPDDGKPQGNISSVSSVAELLRTYFEDILGRKGIPRKEPYEI